MQVFNQYIYSIMTNFYLCFFMSNFLLVMKRSDHGYQGVRKEEKRTRRAMLYTHSHKFCTAYCLYNVGMQIHAVYTLYLMPISALKTYLPFFSCDSYRFSIKYSYNNFLYCVNKIDI